MKVILVSGKHGQSRTLFLSRLTRTVLSLCMLGLPLGIGAYLGYEAGQPEGDVLDAKALQVLKAQLDRQASELAQAREQAGAQLQAMTLRLAELQARVVRLDAVGERITAVAKLDQGEFDFSAPPAMGGPEAAFDTAYAASDFIAALDSLAQQVDDRQQQMDILETLLVNRKIEDDVFLTGQPVKKGWISSNYGHRRDPFTGRMALHEGIDFAGKFGSDIIAVASGVVTWSGERYGYGQLVEVNHGNGLVSRYAHNHENLVAVGDIVKKGQTIALMGSSGRSTGSHVHFEVYKHGRSVDPAAYIHRASR